MLSGTGSASLSPVRPVFPSDGVDGAKHVRVRVTCARLPTAQLTFPPRSRSVAAGYRLFMVNGIEGWPYKPAVQVPSPPKPPTASVHGACRPSIRAARLRRPGFAWTVASNASRRDGCYDRGAPLFFLILPLNLGA